MKDIKTNKEENNIELKILKLFCSKENNILFRFKFLLIFLIG